jgi:HEAT repeat protein
MMRRAAKRGDAETLIALVAPKIPAIDRALAAGYLGRVAGARSMETLIGLLSDGEVEVRVAAAKALGEGRMAGARTALRRALHDEDALVSAWAAWALGEVGATEARTDLQQYLAGTKSWKSVRGASMGLAALGGKDAAASIHLAAKDERFLRRLQLRRLARRAARH